ncbi:hypothetical protein COZ84_01845 [Candidatus Kuenenbacteria bacterium CG_4_8_14_3_um_filter_39_15]|uniref:ABC transporter substrate-binding protein n=1 Tax=Candidatus Kuenenbacteria bacterium CG_4_8_14_3_um_filter_39_15 TaxID=1974615 RepID=A0A2M7ILV6_9BACT|nr:MAG: hypothetical protein COZ84_01845 [Candidatus Kuenenbacteria bacterium CG_4_8_14_3_um_filter_39_15]
MRIKLVKFKLIVILLVFMLLATGCGLKQGDTQAMSELKTPITIRYWRVFDGPDAFQEVINAYKQAHPNVNIEYRKLRYDEYEQALLEAWAEDRGPDIFTVHNSWLAKYESKILAMPETVKLPYAVQRNSRTGDVEKALYQQVNLWTPIDIRNNFAEVVYQDVVRDNKIWGLPLSVDSLALFYNRTLLDNALITKVPSTWLAVKEAVKKLTLQDEAGNIQQSGIALGTADNINRAFDIVSLLMMQNGTQMTDDTGSQATFHQPSPYSADKSFKPGMEALRFYTDFALPSKEVYNWSEEMPEATDSFVRGKLGMMLGYAYQLPLIRTQGVKLNIGVAEAPHINSDGTDALGAKVNIASYWVETVSAKTKYANYAWDFLQFASSKEQVIKYLAVAKKPAALRNLISAQLNQPDVKPFANQVLTAQSWYRGRNPLAAEEIFRQMIQAVLAGSNTAEEAIGFGAKKINQTF